MGPTAKRIKAGIEDFCRQVSFKDRTQGEMEIVMRVLASMLPPKVFVCSDRQLWSQEFANITGKRAYWVRDIDSLRGLEDFNLIFLGPYNKNAARLEDFAQTRRGVTIWHIEDWR